MQMREFSGIFSSYKKNFPSTINLKNSRQEVHRRHSKSKVNHETYSSPSNMYNQQVNIFAWIGEIGFEPQNHQTKETIFLVKCSTTGHMYVLKRGSAINNLIQNKLLELCQKSSFLCSRSSIKKEERWVMER